MTKDCIKEVFALQQKCEDFNDLTVEQLLFAAIAGTDFNEVLIVLRSTDWSKWVQGESGDMFKVYHAAPYK